MEDRFMLIDASNHMMCEGRVKEFWRTEGTFKIESGMEELRRIEEGQLVRFMFMEGRRGLFIGKVSDIQGTTILVENIESMGTGVKEDVRIDTDIPTKLFCTTKEGDIRAWSVVIWDISAGGARIQSKAPIPLERVMELAVPYDTTYMMVTLLPLREQSDSGYFQYGCKFYNLTNTEEKLMRCMVFKIAARQAKRG